MSKHLAENRPTVPDWWTLAVLAVVMTAGVIATGLALL